MEEFALGELNDCTVTYGAGVAPCCRYTVTIPDNYRECKIRGPNSVTFTDIGWIYPGAPTGDTNNNHFIGGFAEVDNVSNVQATLPTNVEAVNAPIVLGVAESGISGVILVDGVGSWPLPAQVGPDSLSGTVNFFPEDVVTGEWLVRLYPDEPSVPPEVFGELAFECPTDVKLNLTLTSYTVP